MVRRDLTLLLLLLAVMVVPLACKPSPTPPVPPPEPPPPPPPSAGLRVLIVYESADLSKLPPSQLSVLFSAQVRNYLDAKCIVGVDGKTKEWRLFDKDTDPKAEAVYWQEAMKRPRASHPWVVISAPVGGHEGPLPKTVPEMMTLLKKYGGE